MWARAAVGSSPAPTSHDPAAAVTRAADGSPVVADLPVARTTPRVPVSASTVSEVS